MKLMWRTTRLQMEMTMNDFALGVLVWKFALAMLFCKSFAGVFWHSGREKSWDILSEYHGKEKSIIEQAVRINAFWLHYRRLYTSTGSLFLFTQSSGYSGRSFCP
jgi:hypothetical protein